MVQTGELKNIINELLGIQFNIEKARLDGKVQNLAAYINETTLIASHKGIDGKKAKGIDGKKAKGIDGVAKEDYSVNLKANVEHLVKRMKNGSYKPEPIRRVYIPKDGSNNMRPLGISCYEDKLVVSRRSVFNQVLR